jgi:hypothetical protein
VSWQRGVGCLGALLFAWATAACGSRTGLLDAPVPLNVGSWPDASALRDGGEDGSNEGGSDDSGAGVDASADAPIDAPAPCATGTVVGDVFGQTVDFANGAALPAGRYRVTYVDGCMKYSSSQGWTVNAYSLGAGTPDHWWFVAGGQPVTDVIPPGTVGYLPGAGAYGSFDACVQASLALPPVELTITGGPLGVWLQDDPYGDNVPGPNGRSPTWKIECAP